LKNEGSNVPTKKVLVPIDGSGPALRALKWAASAHDADVLVLNVQPVMPSSRFVSKAMIAEHQRRGADEVLASARPLIKRLKLDVRTYRAIGDPAATIVAFAKKHRCYAIVMGSRGHGLIAASLLGSVAAKVVFLAECPVTLVK
jgi:nucleotide-binding universal stress UspA family protein